MTMNIEQFTKETIALQHKQRLMEKKLDVVGVLQAKVHQTYESLGTELNNQTQALHQIDYQSAVTTGQQMKESVDKLQVEQRAIKEDMNTLVGKADDIDHMMKVAYDAMIQTIRESAVNNRQLLTQAVDMVQENKQAIDAYIDAKSLKQLTEDTTQVKESLEKMALDNENLQSQTQDQLSQVAQRLEALRQGGTTLATLQADEVTFLKETEKTLAKIDALLEDAVPSYLEPSADEIINSYEQMAQHQSAALDEKTIWQDTQEDEFVVPVSYAVAEASNDDEVQEEVQEEVHEETHEEVQEPVVDEVHDEEVQTPVEQEEVKQQVTIELPNNDVSYDSFQPEVKKKKSLFAKLFG